MVLISLSGGLNPALRKSGVARGAPRRGQRLRKPRFVPRLEALELRTLPSTLTVLNNLDHGPGSLRDTIAAASSGDTIVFAHSLAHQTITLTSGELDVTKNLNIVGLGADKLTVSGNDASRVFAVASGQMVTLADLTVAHGKAAAGGGGIDNAGSLTVSGVTVTHNQAAGAIGGGGILNEVGASLFLSHCRVADNTATAAAASDVFGGGLLNEGSATVTSSNFSDNQAVDGAGSDFYAGSAGGGIDNFGGATLTVSDSTFINNQALGAAGPHFGAGGGIENNAGLDLMHDSTAIINNSTFTGNVASGGTGVTGNGGGLDNEGALGVVMVVNGCTLTGNLSVGAPGGNGTSTASEGLGGGIANQFGTLTVTNSTLTGNQAIGGDHSIHVAANPPSGSGQGGGLASFGGTVTVIGSTFSGNVARGGNSDAGPGGIATGGGIANWGVALAGVPGTLTVLNSTLSGNEALAGHGGPGPGAFPLDGFAAGGGIDNSFSATASIIDSQLLGNRAVGSAGSAGSAGGNGGTGVGGGISVGFTAFFFGRVDNASLQLIDSTLDHNQAVGGNGGNGGNGGDGLGGGLVIFAGSSATVSASRIEHNSALGGHKGHGGADGHGVGGGVYNLGTFTFDLVTVIKKNHASTSNDDIFP